MTQILLVFSTQLLQQNNSSHVNNKILLTARLNLRNQKLYSRLLPDYFVDL